jgi:hypothetical protein
MAKNTMNLSIRVILAFLTGWLGVTAYSARADESDWVWSSTAMLRQSRMAPRALLVDLPGNIKGVMVIGGITNEKFPSFITGSELYYPRQKESFWSPGPILRTRRPGNTATVLARTSDPKKGRVLVAGGTGSEADGNLTSLDSCELLNPKDNNATLTGPSMKVRRTNHVAVELNDGTVLVVGGERWDKSNPPLKNPEMLRSSEVYDPKTNAWDLNAKSLLNQPRTRAAAVLLTKPPYQGWVLVVGGIEAIVTHTNPDDTISFSAPATTRCDLYDPIHKTWQSAGRLRYPRVFHTLTVLADGKVLAAGGQDQFGGDNETISRSYEIYNPEKNSWICPYDTDRKKHLRHQRSGHAATLLKHSNKVLLVGGDGYTSEIYDPVKDASTFTRDTLWYPRAFPTATLLDDENGTVVVTGGLSNVCEKYEPPSASRFLKGGVARPAVPLNVPQGAGKGPEGGRNNGDSQE